MSIDDDYRSQNSLDFYFKGIKEDMNKFSEIARTIRTTPENVLLYVLAKRLFELEEFFSDEICGTLDEIKESLNTVVDTLEDMKSED